MPSALNPSIQRSDLSQIEGANERVVRYLENLSKAIDDATAKSGSGVPNGTVNSNSSRQYLDLLTGKLWVNLNPMIGQNTGWVML